MLTDSCGALLRFRLNGNHTGGRTVRFQNLQRERVELSVGGRQLAQVTEVLNHDDAVAKQYIMCYKVSTVRPLCQAAFGWDNPVENRNQSL